MGRLHASLPLMIVIPIGEGALMALDSLRPMAFEYRFRCELRVYQRWERAVEGSAPLGLYCSVMS